MPATIIYENAKGEEVVLEDTEHLKRTGEMYGRAGEEFPTIDYTEVKYGDGSTNIIAMQLEPREVKLNFWMDQRSQYYREKLSEIKYVLLQTGQREGNWGKLKIRAADGHFVFLNCAYVGGLDDIIRESWSWVKFTLTFRATDPYFYNGITYSYSIKQDDRSGYLFLNNAVIVDTLTEAQSISGGDSNLYYKISSLSRMNPNKYYAIYPDSEKTVYMESAKIVETINEARSLTGETGNIHPHWWAVNFEETEFFDTKAGAQAFAGTTAEGLNWWTFENDGVVKYQARRTVTRYYVILKKSSLYMRSAQGNIGKDLFIQCEKVYPEITINGPAENIILVNESTGGRKIELDPSIVLDVNEQIKIITAPLKRKITQYLKTGQTVNLIPWLSADSTLDWWLCHGSNEVGFNNTATTPESYAKFEYTERWSSVP